MSRRDAEADEETYWQAKIVEGVRRRIGWLLFLFVAGTLTKYVSHYFKGVQLRLPDLIDFIPLMIGTGGNAGSQTVGTIIRGLALGEIQRVDVFRVLLREGLTGFLLGLVLGASASLHLGLARQSPPSRPSSPWPSCSSASGPTASVPWCRSWPNGWESTPRSSRPRLISTLVDATGLVIFYTVAIVLLIKLGGAAGP